MPQVPPHVLINVSDHVKVNSLLEDVLNNCVCALILHGKVSVLEEEPFAKSLSATLDIIINLVHPNVVELLLFV